MLSLPFCTLSGTMRLIDERTTDGSRRFLLLTREADWSRLCEHVSSLNGARIVALGGDRPEKRLDFAYLGNRFFVRGRNGRLHLSVEDPLCSDLILYHVGLHFERLTGREEMIRE